MSFAKAVNFIFKWEGDYSKDPRDPGGETRYGISKRAYPHLDIKNLTKEKAAQIYFNDYWKVVGCEECKEPKLAMAMFDAAVNVGVGRVKKWLKEDFNADPLDAAVRPKGAKKSQLSHEEFNARREYYYRAEVKKTLRDVYLKGWMNRLNDLRTFIKTL